MLTSHDDDPPEIIDLEHAAEWRLRKVDADPSDHRSATAARQMRKLAEDLRRLRGSALYTEYAALCNWLAESDDISELALRAQDFRERLGFGTWAEDGAGYLRQLIEMAKESSGGY